MPTDRRGKRKEWALETSAIAPLDSREVSQKQGKSAPGCPPPWGAAERNRRLVAPAEGVVVGLITSDRDRRPAQEGDE